MRERLFILCILAWSTANNWFDLDPSPFKQPAFWAEPGICPLRSAMIGSHCKCQAFFGCGNEPVQPSYTRMLSCQICHLSPCQQAELDVTATTPGILLQTIQYQPYPRICWPPQLITFLFLNSVNGHNVGCTPSWHSRFAGCSMESRYSTAFPTPGGWSGTFWSMVSTHFLSQWRLSFWME